MRLKYKFAIVTDGSHNAQPSEFTYSTSKFSVNGITLSLAET